MNEFESIKNEIWFQGTHNSLYDELNRPLIKEIENILGPVELMMSFKTLGFPLTWKS